LSLEAAIHKMTGAAAARLGLNRRGTLRDGNLADIVVLDPATVRNNATYDEPRQFPTGIEHVIVNGTPVVRGGEHTGATPGRGIRLGRD
jgi:N-acyl-D-amino-acid deacylase